MGQSNTKIACKQSAGRIFSIWDPWNQRFLARTADHKGYNGLVECVEQPQSEDRLSQYFPAYCWPLLLGPRSLQHRVYPIPGPNHGLIGGTSGIRRLTGGWPDWPRVP